MRKHLQNQMLVCVGIFALLAVFTSQLYEIIDGSKEIPASYIVLAALCNLVLLWMTIKAYKKENGGDVAEKAAENRNVFISTIVYIGIIAAYIFTMKYISYIVSTYLFVLGSMLYLKIRNVWLLIILPVVLTLGLYFVFTRLLYVFPPSGTIIKIRWY